MALNNLAAIMVKKGKLDEAHTYLNQALPRAKDYMVQVNRVCSVGTVSMPFKSGTAGPGNQELAPLLLGNIDMVKHYKNSVTKVGTPKPGGTLKPTPKPANPRPLAQ